MPDARMQSYYRSLLPVVRGIGSSRHGLNNAIRRGRNRFIYRRENSLILRGRVITESNVLGSCLCECGYIAHNIGVVLLRMTKQELTPKGGGILFFPSPLSSCDLLLNRLLNYNNIPMDVNDKMDCPQERLSIAVLGCGQSCRNSQHSEDHQG
jgi:hypothetical protein